MSDIFLSFEDADRRHVDPIVSGLRKRGWSAFEKHDVPSGQNLDDALQSELRRARCVVVLWSRSSIASNRVQQEASIAKYRRILVPAIVDASMTAEHIPPSLRDIQAAQLVDRDDLISSDLSPLISSVEQVLSRRRRLGPRGWLAVATTGLVLLGLVLAGYIELLSNARRAHLKRIEYGVYTTGENKRLGDRIKAARTIKILAPNGNSLVHTFGDDFRSFFSERQGSMKVILATATSDFYREMTQMTFSTDWNEDKKREVVFDNMKRVDRSKLELAKTAGDASDQRIQFKYFNTQFRVPMIIVNDRDCYLTIRLPPDEGAQSLRLEFEDGAGYAASCVKHFDRLWELSSDDPGRPVPVR